MKDVDKLSYKKLKKFIATNHPVSPNTGEKFSIFDRITVKDFYLKLLDMFGCIRFYGSYRDFKKKCYKICLKNKKRKFVKPNSMKDMPDSGSNSSDDPQNTF